LRATNAAFFRPPFAAVAAGNVGPLAVRAIPGFALEVDGLTAQLSAMTIRMLPLLICICSVGLLAACDRNATPATSTSGLSTDQFVELYVELRNAKRESRADAEFQQKKREILARARTTEEKFSSFVDDHGRDLTLMAAVWDSIQRRIDRGDSIGAR
jgi:hypothetical protein